MAPLLWALGAALAGYAGYELTKKTPRFLGDLAKDGDNVQAGIDAFITQNSLPSNTPIAADAIGGFLFLKVERTDDENVFGPLIVSRMGGNVIQEMRPKDFNIPSTQFRVARASITMINRGGKTATAATTGFHGEFSGSGRVFQG